ncbi:MAG: hypothetical protein KGV51_00920 [Moraxellaceae bacterium]|nr:hypothetical protein [Moraxellaceae bacterium]MBS9779164.1 hypothetical protein [Moraxellaceae bacterium]
MKLIQVKQLATMSFLAVILPACTATSGDISGLTNIISQPTQTVTQPTDTTSASVPMPKVSISNVKYIKTMSIPTTTTNGAMLDVSKIDEFIEDVTPNLRHYPPNFPNKTDKYNAKELVKKYVIYLQPYSDAPNASYEVLMRSAILNGMARNLDLGSNYAVSASDYVGKAIELKPDDLEANLLYGIMLSEGGAFTTSRKYLDKVASMGSVEAEQTIAQSDLMNDKRSDALSRLQKLQAQHPNNAQIAKQIKIIESGGYRLWDLPAPNVNIETVP